MSYKIRYVAKERTNWAEKERLDAEAAERKARGDDGNMHGVFFTVEKIEMPTTQ